MSEIGLIASVLQRAIDDIRDYKRDYLSGRYNVRKSVNETDDAWARRKSDNDRNAADAKLNHDSAVNWFKSTQRDYLFSFESCCLLLDLNAESVREKVLGITSKSIIKNQNELLLSERIAVYSIAHPTASITEMARIFKVRRDRIKSSISRAYVGLRQGGQGNRCAK